MNVVHSKKTYKLLPCPHLREHNVNTARNSHQSIQSWMISYKHRKMGKTCIRWNAQRKLHFWTSAIAQLVSWATFNFGGLGSNPGLAKFLFWFFILTAENRRFGVEWQKPPLWCQMTENRHYDVKWLKPPFWRRMTKNHRMTKNGIEWRKTAKWQKMASNN